MLGPILLSYSLIQCKGPFDPATPYEKTLSQALLNGEDLAGSSRAMCFLFFVPSSVIPGPLLGPPAVPL